MKFMCTEGCVIFYHYPCWRAFERFYKASHLDFNWKVRSHVDFAQLNLDTIVVKYRALAWSHHWAGILLVVQWAGC